MTADAGTQGGADATFALPRASSMDKLTSAAEYVVIPETNIWKLDPSIPQEYASILDPLGNAVHTVLAGEIAAKSVAITGCGPIGLFSIAVARACGATTPPPSSRASAYLRRRRG